MASRSDRFITRGGYLESIVRGEAEEGDTLIGPLYWSLRVNWYASLDLTNHCSVNYLGHPCEVRLLDQLVLKPSVMVCTPELPGKA